MTTLDGRSRDRKEGKGIWEMEEPHKPMGKDRELDRVQLTWSMRRGLNWNVDEEALVGDLSLTIRLNDYGRELVKKNGRSPYSVRGSKVLQRVHWGISPPTLKVCRNMKGGVRVLGFFMGVKFPPVLFSDASNTNVIHKNFPSFQWKSKLSLIVIDKGMLLVVVGWKCFSNIQNIFLIKNKEMGHLKSCILGFGFRDHKTKISSFES